MQRSGHLLLKPTPGGTLIEAEQAETKGGVIESSIKGHTGMDMSDSTKPVLQFPLRTMPPPPVIICWSFVMSWRK